MVIDSSAFVAIVEGEPERQLFVEAIAASPVRRVGAPTLLETGMVLLGRRGEERLRDLQRFCTRARLEIISFAPEHVDLALDAFRRFGKGRHPAGLNLGDCFSYALAKATGEPLLFKGEDLAQTDVRPAV